MKIRQKFETANRLRKEQGWPAVGNKIRLWRRRRREERNYRKWILAHRMTPEKREKIRAEIAGFPRRPLLSVILPVYNVEEKWLRACLESVCGQLYENWELCLADDHSPAPHVRRVLEEYASRDNRIKIVYRAANGHISAASNSALELARGEFSVLLDHDDELSEDALFYVAKELNDFPETAFIYSDEDMIDETGRRYQPKFKPDFSPDLFYSLNLVTHLSAYKTEILRKIGGFRLGLEGSQDYDLALRFIEEIDPEQIRHIPRILYHWRAIRGSVAFSSDEKPYAHERARQALREHFARLGKQVKVERGIYNLHRVCYRLPENPPRVSLILSAREDSTAAGKSVAEFFEKTEYENFEIVLLCPESAARQIESKPPPGNFRIVSRRGRSESENLNRAVLQSSGEILCFVDTNLSPLRKDWLTELAGFAAQKEIGAAGAKILDQNEMIRHGGFVFGFENLIGIAHGNLPRETDGNLYRAQVAGNFSAVSLQGLTARRELFEQSGGFDAENLPDALFDADFCLRLREKKLADRFDPLR
jgi:glycosyltransferase involved in cell wall biosynthesis